MCNIGMKMVLHLHFQTVPIMDKCTILQIPSAMTATHGTLSLPLSLSFLFPSFFPHYSCPRSFAMKHNSQVTTIFHSCLFAVCALKMVRLAVLRLAAVSYLHVMQ